MTAHDVRPADFLTLDAGELLPGCSVPVCVREDGDVVHAFNRFRPLSLDGLNRSAKHSLTDSMLDVVESLDALHQQGRCYGRIRSQSLHNRGTDASPRATLWIDPDLAAQTDAVHSGDPESIYWTAARLKSDAAPQKADDWYALGVVLAEIQLSTAAVHRIWELSRQEGRFAETLIKNLRRSRGNRRLKSTAIRLLEDGAAGKVDAPTVVDSIGGRGRSGLNAGASLAVAAVALLALSWNLYQGRLDRAAVDGQVAALRTENEELLTQAEERRRESSSAPEPAWSTPAATPAATPAVEVSPPTDALAEQRDRWTEQVAGRPLEEAVMLLRQPGDAGNRPAWPRPWRESLSTLAAVNGQQQWRQSDPKLRRLVQQAVDAPWDPERYSNARSRFTALDEAYARWQNWARGTRSIDEIKTQQALMSSGVTKDLLGEWLAQTLELDSLDLSVTAAAGGEEDGWTAHRVGYETPSGSESADWVWEDGKRGSIRLEVPQYRAGDPLTFWVKQDSSIPLWDSTVIKHTFNSPLLVWQLGRELRLEDSESGYVILLKTETAVGPPSRLESTHAENPEPAERQVVDPLDDLPLDFH